MKCKSEACFALISVDLSNALRPTPYDEASINAALVELLRLKGHRDLIWFHPANGGQRSPIVADILGDN